MPVAARACYAGTAAFPNRGSTGDSMKLNNTVVTLALLGVLALAALAGGLLPVGNPVHAADPMFDTNTSDRSIPENTPPGANIGDPISATDDDETGDDTASPVVVAVEFGDTLTYSLSGTDAASFDIDPSTGQLITKAPLNHETKESYEVTVTVKDGSGTSVTQDVMIDVTNVAEAPGGLAAPTVVSTDLDDDDTFDLKVIWYAPDDAGDDVTGYDVEYKETTETSFGTTNVNHSGTATTATITALDVDTAYHVRVRAKKGNNAGDLGPWSLSRVGSTNKKDNALPTFGAASVTRNVLENSDPGLVVGFKVSADGRRSPAPAHLRAPWSGRQLVRPAVVDRADTDEERRGVRLRDEANTQCDDDRLRQAGRKRRDGGDDQRHKRARGRRRRLPDRPFGRRRDRAGAST